MVILVSKELEVGFRPPYTTGRSSQKCFCWAQSFPNGLHPRQTVSLLDQGIRSWKGNVVAKIRRAALQLRGRLYLLSF
jgi:hypothetical protein